MAHDEQMMQQEGMPMMQQQMMGMDDQMAAMAHLSEE